MATSPFTSVEEYLRTSYRPDRDYVDGAVLERNVGEGWHSAVLTMLLFIFGRERKKWGLIPLPSMRMQLTRNHFRVPDVCVVQASQPFTPILHTPPVLCVEILSTEDRFSRILERVEEYVAMGVPHVWIIDPRSREIWTVGADSRPVSFRGDVLSLPGTLVQVTVPEIFALIDEVPGGTAA